MKPKCCNKHFAPGKTDAVYALIINTPHKAKPML
jgi:hypothetical protein